METLLRLWLVS